MKWARNLNTCIEEFVGSVFWRFGFLVGTWPWIFVFLSILVTIICGYGFSNFSEMNDVYEQYTPLNSPSRQERDAWIKFIGNKYTKHLQSAQPIVIRAKNNQRLFDRFHNDSTKALARELDFMENRLSIKFENSLFTYQNFCKPFCQTNFPFRAFLMAFDQRRSSNSSNIKLSHPVIKIFGTPINIGSHIYSVKKDSNGNVNSVAMVQWHFSGSNRRRIQQHISKWRLALYQYANSHKQFDMYTLLNSQFNAEIRKSGIAALPLFGISFAVVGALSVVTTLRADCIHSKPWEAVAGVMSPVFAVIASFGLLIFVGVKFQPMVTVSLFLVLAIGVDDMFIMLHTWHQTFDQSLGVAERMACCLCSSGPSITITSLTNTLSFAIGISTTTPAIHTFCLFTSTALLVDYVFQMTYFAAILSISGSREAQSRNSCICCLTQKKGHSGLYQSFMMQTNNLCERVLKLLTKVVLMDMTVLLATVGLIIYWGVSIYGCSIIKVDLNAGKLLLVDSSLHRWLKVQKQLHDEMGVVAVLVRNPGNLSDYSQRRKHYNLVSDVANVDYRYSLNTSSFWLDNYLIYTRFLNVDFSYSFMRGFLRTTKHAIWNLYIKKNLTACDQNLPDCVSMFVFTVGYHGLSDLTATTRLVGLWRTILKKDQYKDLKASLFFEPAFVCDQISTIGKVSRNTLLITMCCMAVMCVIFVPDLYITPFAVIVMVSINLGVFGFVPLWGVDLDPIALAGLLITIGFSVDFTAHVIYHFHKSESQDQFQDLEEKLLHTYKLVAWPMLQAGTSTVLCLGVLVAHNSYVILTFVKTVTLSVIFGLTHGLVVLPIGLSYITKLRKKLDLKRQTNVDQNTIHLETFEGKSNVVID